MARLRLVQHYGGSPHIPIITTVPLPPPDLSEPEPLNQLLL